MSNVKTIEITSWRGWWIVIALAIGTVLNGTFALWSVFTGGDISTNIVVLSTLNLALISNLSLLVFAFRTNSQKGVNSRDRDK